MRCHHFTPQRSPLSKIDRIFIYRINKSGMSYQGDFHSPHSSCWQRLFAPFSCPALRITHSNTGIGTRIKISVNSCKFADNYFSSPPNFIDAAYKWDYDQLTTGRPSGRGSDPQSRGKSALHRALCRVTPGAGQPAGSGHRNIPPDSGKGEMVV